MKDILETISLYDDDATETTDDKRVLLNKGTMPIKQALAEIIKEKGTNFTSQKELTDLVAGKVGYTPNVKILRPSKYPILKKVTYETTSRPFTTKELKDILGDDLRKFRAQGLTDRQIRDRAAGRKQFKNLSDEAKARKRERNRINLAKRISLMSPAQREKLREQDALRMQEQRGTKPKYHRVSNAKSLLWNDLIRAAEAKDGYLNFKNFTPEPGKYYNKAETEKIVLVDKQGNEFKFNSLKDDINKYSGYKAEDVFKPYNQREFLNKQGLTQEINRFYGIKPGSRQSVFNVQHVQGIAKNPFNVTLTFADQNIAEAGAKRTFDAEFKASDSLSKKKAAVKKFYKSLGPDIATQLGRKEVGKRRTLPELLEKTKFPIQSDIIKQIKNNPQLNAKVPILTDILEMAKSIPDDFKRAKYLKGAFKAAGVAVTPLVIYDTYKAFEQGKPVLEALEQGLIGTDIIGGTKRFLSLTPEERTARSVVKQNELQNLNIDMPEGFGFIEGPTPDTDMTLEEAMAKATAGEERVKQLEAQKNLERATNRGNFFSNIRDRVLGITPDYQLELANGGIAGLSGGIKSGPPPERGPDSQGLRSLMKRGINL